jgi:hypothetical protein
MSAVGFREGHGPMSGVTVLDLSGYVPATLRHRESLE